MRQWLSSLFGGNRQKIPQNKYILVVDDGENERMFYTRTLKKAGYEVEAVNGGAAALESIAKRFPDLVITDFYMPEMNGRELCDRLKHDPRTAQIPIVFLTGSARPADIVDCFDAGCEYYLEKPIDARTLVRQVTTILSDLEEESAGRKAA